MEVYELEEKKPEYPIFKLVPGERVVFTMGKCFEFKEVRGEKEFRRFEITCRLEAVGNGGAWRSIIAGTQVMTQLATAIRTGYSIKGPWSILKTGEGINTLYDVKPEHELPPQPEVEYDKGKKQVQEIMDEAAEEHGWDLQKKYDVLCDVVGVEIENSGDMMDDLYRAIEDNRQ